MATETASSPHFNVITTALATAAASLVFCCSDSARIKLYEYVRHSSVSFVFVAGVAADPLQSKSRAIAGSSASEFRRIQCATVEIVNDPSVVRACRILRNIPHANLNRMRAGTKGWAPIVTLSR